MVVRFGASRSKEAWDVELVHTRRWQQGRGQGRGGSCSVLEAGQDQGIAPRVGLSRRQGLRHSSDVG